jgi:hypothetical protein
MEEYWKVVEECPSYLISNMGNVKNIKELKTLKVYNRKGYTRIDLYDRRIKKPLKRSVHRLVAEAFIPNPLNKPQVNHIDGDKKNNRVENLEWCTASENIKHAFKEGLSLKGEDRHNSKMTEEKVILLREMYDSGEFLLKELAEEFNISISVAWRIAKRNTWKHI